MYLNIDELSKKLKVSKHTLRRWEKEGKITSERTIGGHRRYLDVDLHNNLDVTCERFAIAYARVSTYGQKEDLVRQKQVLEMYCSSKGYKYKVIEDIGSGINYKKKGLKELLGLIMSGEIDRIIITHKDRLLRFGSELIFHICELSGIKIDIINLDEMKTDDESEFVKDVLEVITVFSSKLYGKRSHKNKKILEENKKMFVKEYK